MTTEPTAAAMRAAKYVCDEIQSAVAKSGIGDPDHANFAKLPALIAARIDRETCLPDLLAALERYVTSDSGSEVDDDLHRAGVAAIAKAKGGAS